MSNANYKIVLSDKLYSIYKKAGTKNTLNSKERRSYELLIGNIELDILTNAAQLERCKLKHNLPDEIYNDLYPALINSDDKDLTLIELAKKTLFKLIITQNNEDISPPYFNLNDNNVIRNYII
ncbi:TPA: hypothetical protein U2J86_005185, partial [Serratia marcescens]|nr:hypothetical protein [Serratia marcescens]